MPGLFHTCPTCGSNLDPGEACDCRPEDLQESVVLGAAVEPEPVERGGADQ